MVFGDDDPERMPEHFFFGARRLSYETAERADVSKQHYTMCPRHWYVDATFICGDCDREFVFTAKEQRFWYEERGFFVDSLPKRCARCRKAQRTRVELRKRYDELIGEALDAASLETKKKLIEVINELEIAEGEIPERMIENRTRLSAELVREG
jgi:hypothetical protein